MISTFDRMSGGRICINLIAGQNESEVEGEGVRYAKEERYALMEEEVSILKALWTTRGPVNFEGQFHTLRAAHIRPRPLQQPFPKFYLGGGSREAWEMSAKHSDVHLFWGDLPERIAANIAEIRAMASAHGRENTIGFGMRLQVICREHEKDAWEAADILVRNATERQKQEMKTLYNNSAANQRVQQLAREHGDLLLPHLWTGITRVRPGAGIAVVGNPAQCADTAAIHRRRLPFVLPVRLSARRGGRALRAADPPDPRREQSRPAGGVAPEADQTWLTRLGADQMRQGPAALARLIWLGDGRHPRAPRAEQLPHLRTRLGGAEQIALHLGAAQRAKHFLLLLRLDAFRGRRHVARGGDVHHRLHDAPMSRRFPRCR